MDKKDLRQQVITLRSQLSEVENLNKSILIKNRLFEFDIFLNAQVITSFMSYNKEVSMTNINLAIIDSGKVLGLPHISKKMNFYRVNDLMALKKNSYGIEEPIPDPLTCMSPKQVEFVLTPGVAFTTDGKRLGYGGGYYDQFFQNLPSHIPRVGIAFDLQIVESIPLESHDYLLNYLITESKIYHFDSKK